MDHLSALLLVTTGFLSVAVAFQTCPSGLVGVSSHRSTSPLRLATASFPSPNQKPFVLPLLHDVDWIHGFRERVGRHSTAASDYDEEDDVLLDYLPWFVLQQTPKPKELIAQATRQYVYGDTRGDPKVNVTEVLQLVDEEYKCTDVPVKIGDTTLSVERDRKHLQVVRILSFAAYHRLPQDITALLFGDDKDLQGYKETFLKNGGWASVSFPRGLSIRLPRNRLTSKLDRYQPIPRRFLQANNIKSAKRAVQEASRIKAPVQRRLSKEAFLSTLQKEMGSSEKKAPPTRLFPHFPTAKRDAQKLLRRQSRRALLLLRTTLLRVKQSIRATLLSYGLLAFAWYNVAILWQWQGLSSTAFAVSSTAMRASLHRIGGVVAQTYATSHLFAQLPVLLLALSVAPLAHRLLVLTKTRMGVTSEDRALLLVGSTLAISHLVFGASLYFLDAAILRSLVL